MSGGLRTMLGAALIALAAGAPAQDSGEKIQRPFGSVPLMVAPNKGPAGASCNAACLTGLVNSYADALAKQDGAALPWADKVRYAENGVAIMIGDGTWATATARGTAPLIVADPVTHKAVWLGSVDDHGQPGFLALELTAQGDRIAAVQAVIRRKEGRPPFGDPVAFAHDAAFGQTLAKGQATPRAAMIALANGYFAAQGGKATAAPAFGPGCKLVENGVVMTGNLPAAAGETGDCGAAFGRQLFKEYEAVRGHVVAVDEARGIVATMGFRDLPAGTMRFTAADGASYAAEAAYSRSVAFVTLFKIAGGKILRVESIANEVPYLMSAPWEG